MKRARLIPMLIAVLVVGGCGAIATSRDDRGTVAESIVEKLAARGDADAQVTLGWMHETGRTVAKNPAAAARWYRKSAEQGNALAQYYLAELHARGAGVPADPAAAAAWYRKSAEQGNALAQIRLGRIYEHGIGVKRDYAAAAEWYARAHRLWSAQASYPPGAERLVGPLPAPLLLTRPAVEAAGLGRTITVADGTPPTGSLEAAMAAWKAKQQAAGAMEVDGAATGDIPGDIRGLWIHVASFRAPARAVSYRDEIRSRHNDLLGALQVRLTPVDLGADKGMWVRVRAGPIPDMKSAAALCRGLRARKIYCATLSP